MVSTHPASSGAMVLVSMIISAIFWYIGTLVVRDKVGMALSRPSEVGYRRIIGLEGEGGI